MGISVNDITNLDYKAVEEYLSNFLMEVLSKSGKKGFVVGVSGGIDSAVAYTLAVKSIGVKNVLALVMPDKNVTPEEDVVDAVELIKSLGGAYHVIEISTLVEAYTKSIPITSSEDKLPIGNLRARIRMCILYYYANKLDYLVLGTSDRSEYLLGYFTKYGDGASDVAPLTALYKTQVRKFGEFLGVPMRILKKPSSPRLWPGHLAEEELGLRYEDIDPVLFAYVDLGIPEDEIPKVVGVGEDTVRKVLNMYRSSAHKRLGVLLPNPKPIVDQVAPSILKKLKLVKG